MVDAAAEALRDHGFRGRLDEARKQLDRALERDFNLQKWPREDVDLKPLRVAGES